MALYTGVDESLLRVVIVLAELELCANEVDFVLPLELTTLR